MQTMAHFASQLRWHVSQDGRGDRIVYVAEVTTNRVWSRNKQGFYHFKYRAEVRWKSGVRRWSIHVYRKRLCPWERTPEQRRYEMQPIYSVPDTATTLPAAKAKARLVIREHFTEWDQTEYQMEGASEEYIREHCNAS